ncbi:MAG: iron-containing alcohol dehydrogenase [Candidatus Jordarchaeum sp.]|uniref:iron-containing alcohol dehydrogenase n=1 Tax=Candidatus Jordarchaeum sp. TaxID=2823881 RepID=UPI00404988CE
MWFFIGPKVVFGEDALDYLEQIRGSKTLIVTDRIIVDLGIVDKVKDKLKIAGIECEVFDEVEPDPSDVTVMRIVDKLKSYEPDWILGLGGGSSMDAAKTAWVLWENPDKRMEDINAFTPVMVNQKARLITVATTSGTGSEVTWATVVTNTKEHRKMILMAKEIVPFAAIVDPKLTVSMPPKLTAVTGMDALTHAVESYINSWKNDFSDALAMRSIQLIFEYLPRACMNSDDMEARTKMANAATMAGLSFGNSSVGIAHGVAHSVGAVFGLPHGLVCGVALPYVIEYNISTSAKFLAELAELIGIKEQNEKKAAKMLADRTRQLMMEIGIPLSLKESGIVEKDFKENFGRLIRMIYEDASATLNPRSFTREEIEKIYQCIYYGKEIDF